MDPAAQREHATGAEPWSSPEFPPRLLYHSFVEARILDLALALHIAVSTPIPSLSLGTVQPPSHPATQFCLFGPHHCSRVKKQTKLQPWNRIFQRPSKICQRPGERHSFRQDVRERRIRTTAETVPKNISRQRTQASPLAQMTALPYDSPTGPVTSASTCVCPTKVKARYAFRSYQIVTRVCKTAPYSDIETLVHFSGPQGQLG